MLFCYLLCLVSFSLVYTYSTCCNVVHALYVVHVVHVLYVLYVVHVRMVETHYHGSSQTNGNSTACNLMNRKIHNFVRKEN